MARGELGESKDFSHKRLCRREHVPVRKLQGLGTYLNRYAKNWVKVGIIVVQGEWLW